MFTLSNFFLFSLFFLSVSFDSFLFRFFANIAVINTSSAIDIVTVGFHEVIARSEVQMGTGNEFLNFNLIKK